MASAPQTKKVRKRNPQLTRAAILQAALEEFSAEGMSGARVDRIANRAGASKPMIYEYFGDKNALYAAALREAYVQIRRGEQELNLDRLEPEDGIRALISFTMNHFSTNPWFIRMLNTENLLKGKIIDQIEDVSEIQSFLLLRLEEVLDRGRKAGDFHSNIGAVDLYIMIAAICWFPVSNKYTLRRVFGTRLDAEWREEHLSRAADMIITYLRKSSP